jgi:hypothetical protein
MALWGKSDDLASVPKTRADKVLNTAKTYFVDTTEASVAGNRAKGIKTPGWNTFTTYTDNLGRTRRRVEVIVPMKVTAGTAGDAGTANSTVTEDLTVPDA